MGARPQSSFFFCELYQKKRAISKRTARPTQSHGDDSNDDDDDGAAIAHEGDGIATGGAPGGPGGGAIALRSIASNCGAKSMRMLPFAKVFFLC